jgi:hypothetical protein
LEGVLLAGCGAPHPTATPSPPVLTTTTTAPATTTTSTSLDPGGLPQTTDRPTSGDARFRIGAAALWEAVVSGNPADALDFFFPQSAYVQVKAIADPVADWHHRLLAAYDADILALHRTVAGQPGPAAFVALDLGPAPTWVAPGSEYNRIGYWRVYGSRVRYLQSGRVHSFAVASLISWRGEWYVVHLSSIR